MIKTLPFLKSVFVVFGLLFFFRQANAQEATEFVFRTPTLISGVADQDGAIYKFKNVAPGLDANVTVVGRSGPEVFLDTIDIPLSNGMGYDKALQPQVGLHGTAPANTSWSMTFKVNFLKAGTNKSANIDNFVASAIDVDGDNLSIAENIEMYKAYGVTTSIYSVLTSVLPMTAFCPKHKMTQAPIDCPKCDGLGYIIKKNGKVENCDKCDNTGKLFAVCQDSWVGSDIMIAGTSFNAAGIDTLAINNMATFSYANTDEVLFSYGGTTGELPSSAGQRLNSLWFKSFNYSVSSLLGVQSLNFSATAQQNAVALQWSTAQKDVSEFIVERSVDGIHFSGFATVHASTETGSMATYKYNDASVDNVPVIYYRLKMITLTGQTGYSAIKTVGTNQRKGNASIVAYPNPVKQQLYITMPAAWTGKRAVAAIYNDAGIQVKSVQLNAVAQVENMEVSQLPRGMYTVNILCMDTTQQTRIFKN